MLLPSGVRGHLVLSVGRQYCLRYPIVSGGLVIEDRLSFRNVGKWLNRGEKKVY